MIIIELTRKDLRPFCKKTPLKLINRSEIDEERLMEEGNFKKHDWYRAKFVRFTDDDSQVKLLKEPKSENQFLL
jgi:hypothetical protein